jgi:hypothetical protein
MAQRKYRDMSTDAEECGVGLLIMDVKDKKTGSVRACSRGRGCKQVRGEPSVSNIHTNIHKYAHTYIHAHIHTYMHTYIHTHTHILAHLHIHKHIHTYVRTGIHTYFCTSYIHTYPR